MRHAQSPSSSPNIVLIGKNSRGIWVALEQDGLFGGLFVSRAAAIKFVLFENGHHPERIVETPRILELILNRPSSANRAPNGATVALQRPAA